MRILLIEDSPELAQALSGALRDFGVSCDIAGCAQDAGLMLGQSDYAMVVLDLGLPDEDGLALLRTWRASSIMIPVIVLTARTDVDTRITVLRSGADDYLAKPFEVEELHARMEAVMRRIWGSASEVRFGELSFDASAQQFSASGKPLRLSRREAEVFEPLLRRGGKVVPRRTLETQLFGIEDDFGSNAIEVYVHRLRRKLEDAGAKVRIETVHGIGYALMSA
ncbi:MAG: response regulator [Sphingomonadaceae bacterium]